MSDTLQHILQLLLSGDERNHALGKELMQSQNLQAEVLAAIFPPSDWVWVEGGSFEMGSSKGKADAKPVHTVILDGFYMQCAPITQQQYQLIMGVNPSHFQGCADCPVEQVSWYDAIMFCNALSEWAGLSPVYTIDKSNPDPNNRNSADPRKWTVQWNPQAHGYRLPTEAEWEFAARGGVQSKGYLYAGSNYLEEVAWTERNSWRKTQPVKTKTAE